jgi:protein tyrosine phosphatase (PTP) superfamily phosphohydrolase (DUF442 family)
MRWSRLGKLALRSSAAAALIVGGFILARWGSGNTGVVVPAAVYRSAQLTARGLTREIERHRIRTVLNLRGPNPDQPWYRAERAATLTAAATQVDVPMASDHWLSRQQARTLVELLEGCERPLLIHCEWGAERTGLAAAFAELLRPGGSLASARRQFSPWYLFLPTRDGRIMRKHLDAYARWLATARLEHTPQNFRTWVRFAYHPGYPSRDDWPYDPYPLAVVTRPPTGEAVVKRPVGAVR